MNDDPDVSDNFCVGREDGNYNHPTDRTKFVTCVNNIPVSQNCPEGTRFDRDVADNCL
jgi:hypothetical protein